MNCTAVAMLSKSPAVDRCKTRLTETITQGQANDLQGAIIDDIFAKITPEIAYDLWVAAPSTESLVYFQPLTHRAPVQKGQDLGEKMYNLVAALFAEGYHQVILVGSDMPLLTSELLIKAKHSLERCDCVIGPAEDGGYYLVGMRQLIPEIFFGIAWSTSDVLAQTIERLKSGSLGYDLLPMHRDMDDWDDLKYYTSPEFATRIPNTSSWLYQHGFATRCTNRTKS